MPLPTPGVPAGVPATPPTEPGWYPWSTEPAPKLEAKMLARAPLRARVGLGEVSGEKLSLLLSKVPPAALCSRKSFENILVGARLVPPPPFAFERPFLIFLLNSVSAAVFLM